MHLFSKLSGAVFSGMLLVGSVFAPTSSPTFPASLDLVANPVIKPVTITSTQFLYQQTHGNTVKPIGMTVFTERKSTPTKRAQKETNGPQPAHIALMVPQKNLPRTNQISRGNDDYSTIVEHALSMLGTPYVFGGTTRRGIDCSGFTQYIYEGSGISLPRTSYEQFASGVTVSKNELRSGDLVFFSTYSKGASHVGIYIGGGRFIQAANPSVGVTITDLNSSFYSTRYLGARRYI